MQLQRQQQMLLLLLLQEQRGMPQLVLRAKAALQLHPVLPHPNQQQQGLQ
jgi:hypothetical protein